MRLIFVITLTFIISSLLGMGTLGCGQYPLNRPTPYDLKGDKGDSGTQGIPGSDGTNGFNGNDGHSIVFNSTAASFIQCPAGGRILMIAVDANDSGDLDSSDSNIQTLVICNGLAGADGQDGSDAPPTPFTPVGLVDPCGDAPGIWDEVFIKMADGTLLASFSDNANGKNTRFSVLTPGSYQTTDGDNCVFTLNGSGIITYENHHY